MTPRTSTWSAAAASSPTTSRRASPRTSPSSAKDVIDKIGGSVAGWQVDGKTYALPFSVGVVGFWYNKSLFEQAGITDPPTTWTSWTRPSTS